MSLVICSPHLPWRPGPQHLQQRWGRSYQHKCWSVLWPSHMRVQFNECWHRLHRNKWPVLQHTFRLLSVRCALERLLLIIIDSFSMSLSIKCKCFFCQGQGACLRCIWKLLINTTSKAHAVRTDTCLGIAVIFIVFHQLLKSWHTYNPYLTWILWHL